MSAASPSLRLGMAILQIRLGSVQLTKRIAQASHQSLIFLPASLAMLQ
jgi:hypothetical protein